MVDPIPCPIRKYGSYGAILSMTKFRCHYDQYVFEIFRPYSRMIFAKLKKICNVIILSLPLARSTKQPLVR